MTLPCLSPDDACTEHPDKPCIYGVRARAGTAQSKWVAANKCATLQARREGRRDNKQDHVCDGGNP
jgi:hypothetical protein